MSKVNICFRKLSVAVLLIIFSVEAGADLLVSSLTSGIGRFDPLSGAGGTFIPRGTNLFYATGLTLGTNRFLYVATDIGGEVLRFDRRTGAFVDKFGSINAGSGPSRALFDLQFGPDGSLYATDIFFGVERFSGTNGAALGAFVSKASGGLGEPTAVVFTPDGNYLLVAGDLNSAILRYRSSDGAFVDQFVPTGSGGLIGAADIAFGPDGNLYAANWSGDSILRFSGNDGSFLGSFASGNGLSQPFGLAFSPNGDLYVSSAGNDRIYVFAGANGQFLRSFAATGMDLSYGSFLVFTPESSKFTKVLQHLGPDVVRAISAATSQEDLDGALEPGRQMAGDVFARSVTTVPELESWGLMLIGLFLVGVGSRRCTCRLWNRD